MKFCGTCGTQLADGAKFCPKCGAQQEVQQEVQQNNTQPVQPTQQVNAQPNQGDMQQKVKDGVQKFLANRNAVIAAIAAVAVIVIIILVKMFTGAGSRTMEGAVEAYYDAIVEKDAKAYLDITCTDSLMKALEEEFGYDKKELIEELEDAMDYSYDDVEKVKNIKIADKDKMRSSELRNLLKEIKDDTDVDVKISEMYNVKVEYKYFDADYDEWEEDTDYLTVYKSGSRWFVLPDM